MAEGSGKRRTEAEVERRCGLLTGELERRWHDLSAEAGQELIEGVDPNERAAFEAASTEELLAVVEAWHGGQRERAGALMDAIKERGAALA
ncbi:MAG: hypothetical protein GX601_08205 [Anaerolineales bacterium]|nr:hypothetical protein [Anaerolineales bacterium]